MHSSQDEVRYIPQDPRALRRKALNQMVVGVVIAAVAGIALLYLLAIGLNTGNRQGAGMWVGAAIIGAAAACMGFWNMREAAAVDREIEGQRVRRVIRS